MALLRAHLDQKFPRFVYHDGVFESLDHRNKENLLTVIRAYTELGIQSIVTLTIPTCLREKRMLHQSSARTRPC